MPLSPALMQCALQLIGDRGKPRKREALGTAFCVVVPSERLEGVLHGYIITTHHIIEDQDWERIDVRVPDPESGGEVRPPALVLGWRQPIPRLDLAIAPFPPAGEGLIPAVALGRQLLELRPSVPMIGMPFYYVGLFARLDRMMVRSGTIGAVDQQDIDHDPDYDYDYTAHLVDCRSYGGFSGSPCFLELPYPGLEPKAPAPFPPDPSDPPIGRMQYMHLLCGMFAEHFDDATDAMKARSHLGVGILVRSDDIIAALMTHEARAERAQWDAKIEAS